MTSARPTTRPRGSSTSRITARFANLLDLKEGDNLGKAINDAMAAIEEENPQLKGVLPRTYQSLSNTTLVSLLRSINAILGDIEGDAFGKVYEYFLGKFAVAEGAKGGEYFTPTSIVRLIVEIIEPFNGKILDPACGSGGMFVQSARFVERAPQRQGRPPLDLRPRARRRDLRLCKMNLAVHGLEGQISQSNTYYEDPFKSVGQFDYVMANPPFNVNKIDKTKLEGDKRFPFGLAQGRQRQLHLDSGVLFSAQRDGPCRVRHGQLRRRRRRLRTGDPQETDCREGRRCDRRGRRQLLLYRDAAGDVVVPRPGQARDRREDKVLFIDARKIFHQIDRAHRDWTPEQIEFLANIARLYRGEETETADGSAELVGGVVPGRHLRGCARDCARSRHWSRSRSRTGASTPGVMSASRQLRMMAWTSGFGWRS